MSLLHLGALYSSSVLAWACIFVGAISYLSFRDPWVLLPSSLRAKVLFAVIPPLDDLVCGQAWTEVNAFHRAAHIQQAHGRPCISSIAVWLHPAMLECLGFELFNNGQRLPVNPAEGFLRFTCLVDEAVEVFHCIRIEFELFFEPS